MTESSLKHMAVWDWLYKNTDISELYFTQGEYDSSGELVLNNQVVYTPDTVGSDTWKKQYIRNKGIKEYSLTLSQYAPLISQSNTPANIVTLEVIERISEWVEKQDKTKNYPAFPENCTIQKIMSFPGTIAARDDKGCKIQFVIKIIYEQK